MNNITAKIIKGIAYKPLRGKNLNSYKFNSLSTALKDATFFLDINQHDKLAVSWWVSAKRTRSYPYARIYDSLGFTGKKLTIIPIMKDEGVDGDRDFLQWDTISLMSLLGVYVIISYYKDAEKSKRYKGKISKQKFDEKQIKREINKLVKYQSDPLHWNLEQINKINLVGKKAIISYKRISTTLGVKMHSFVLAEKRISELMKNKKIFLTNSRLLAQEAQKRESGFIHRSENIINGKKAELTISNYLGGYYYFTVDEARIKSDRLYLVEAKNTEGQNELPSINDIKDGLLKMLLFINLEKVKIGKKSYKSIPVLKLTSNNAKLTDKSQKLVILLKKEAIENNFKLEINGKFIV